MADANGRQLIRIARLRRFVGVFARGGDRDAAAEALTELAHASREGGTRVGCTAPRAPGGAAARRDGNRRSRRARADPARLAVPRDRSGRCRSVGGRARARTRASCTEPNRDELFAGATLLAGVAHGHRRRRERWRALGSPRRAICSSPPAAAGAALALVQQGVLDVNAEQPERCRAVLRVRPRFLPAAGLSSAAVEVGGGRGARVRRRRAVGEGRPLVRDRDRRGGRSRAGGARGRARRRPSCRARAAGSPRRRCASPPTAHAGARCWPARRRTR